MLYPAELRGLNDLEPYSPPSGYSRATWFSWVKDGQDDNPCPSSWLQHSRFSQLSRTAPRINPTCFSTCPFSEPAASAVPRMRYYGNNLRE
jgi:hypothetical protein